MFDFTVEAVKWDHFGIRQTDYDNRLDQLQPILGEKE